MLCWVVVLFTYCVTAQWTLVPSIVSRPWSESFSCDVGCRPLVSLMHREILGEFECEDGAIYDPEPPHAKLAHSVLRSILDPPMAPIRINGTFWTGTIGDGWYDPCGAVTFPQPNGAAMLIGRVVNCSLSLPWLCVCPLRDVPIPPPHIRFDDFVVGRIGRNRSETWVYVPGKWVVVFRNRTSALVHVDDPPRRFVDAAYVEYAADGGTRSLLQLSNNSVVHQIGDDFQFNGTHFVAPVSGVYVVGVRRGPGSVHNCTDTCAFRFDENDVVSVNASVASVSVRVPRLGAWPTTTRSPIPAPTRAPTTHAPSTSPTTKPTSQSPSASPTDARTSQPTTLRPTTLRPTAHPTLEPTTLQPTLRPTSQPTTQRPTTRSPTTKSPTRAPAIVVRSAGSKLGGFGTRTTSSAICNTLATCNQSLAMVSYAGDLISGMPTKYNFDATKPLYSSSNVMIASSWTAFASGSLTTSLSSAGVTSSGSLWWTGGTNAAYTCTGWTTNALNVVGTIGNAAATDSGSITFNTAACSTTNILLLCACIE